MLRFDHVVYAVPDLAQASAALTEEWGLHVVMGGEHPNWGTHNSLCHFGLAYIELIAVRDPEKAQETEFGRLVLAGARAGGGPVTTALATDDLDAAVAHLHQNGVAVDGPFEGSRRRPDGSTLAWRMAWPEAHGDLAMPFLIQWQQTDEERSADLKARGIIGAHRHADAQLDAVVYTVRNLEDAVGTFRRYYGCEPGPVYADEGRRTRLTSLDIILQEPQAHPVAEGPKIIQLKIDGTTRLMPK